MCCSCCIRAKVFPAFFKLHWMLLILQQRNKRKLFLPFSTLSHSNIMNHVTSRKCSARTSCPGTQQSMWWFIKQSRRNYFYSLLTSSFSEDHVIFNALVVSSCTDISCGICFIARAKLFASPFSVRSANGGSRNNMFYSILKQTKAGLVS